ncbi:MAG TPA: PspC domain-containing protein, partial [Candidatus Dormibacteraeota bacterium]
MAESVGGGLRRGPDRIIAGVCSGLAEHFHIDPTLVRVIFVALTLVPPAIGIILYLVLWFLMEAPNSSAASSWATGPGPRLRQVVEEVQRELRGLFGPSHAEANRGQPVAPTPGQPVAPARRGGADPGQQRHSRGLWGGVLLIGLGAYLLLANLG